MGCSVLPQLLDFYTTFLDGDFSPNGDYIALCDDQNRLVVVNIANRVVHKQLVLPSFFVSIRTVGELLLGCKADSGICIFNWRALIDGDDAKLKSQAQASTMTTRFASINRISPLDEGSMIIGYRDGVVNVISADSSKEVLFTQKAHSSQITGLSAIAEKVFVSASADGNAALWDLRTGSNPAKTIHVSRESRVQRRGFGNCINVMGANSNFMVCGGDVQMSIWHLGSSSLVHTVDQNDRTADVEWHSLEMSHCSNTFLCGGSSNELFVFDMGAKIKQHVELKIGAINMIKQRVYDVTSTLSVVAGEAANIHLILNEGYCCASISTR